MVADKASAISPRHRTFSNTFCSLRRGSRFEAIQADFGEKFEARAFDVAFTQRETFIDSSRNLRGGHALINARDTQLQIIQCTVGMNVDIFLNCIPLKVKL